MTTEEAPSNLHGFPFKAYKCQREYMKKVEECLLSKKWGILESPTGTGKTLCMLCSSLQWQLRNKGTKIVYATRTHMEINQVIEELRKTNFKPQVAILGSHKKFCTNPAICKIRFKENNDVKARSIPRTYNMREIQELGKRHEFCPYYVSRVLVEKADLILSPYNYFLSYKDYLKITRSYLKGAVYIFDEAHNIPGVCEEAASPSLLNSKLKQVNASLELLKSDIAANKIYIYKRKYPSLNDINPKEIDKLLLIYKNFVHELEKMTLSQFGEKALRSILETMDYSFSNRMIVEKHFKELFTIRSYFENIERFGERECFQYLLDFLAIVISNFESHQFAYQITVQTDTILRVYCFSASIVFNKFKKDFMPHTVILTSGTLSPFKNLENDLGYKFPIVLENSHFIKDHQIFPCILTHSPSSQLIYTYETRCQENTIRDLFKMVKRLYSIVNGGIIIYFPSYRMLELYASKIGNKYKSYIFIEKRDNSNNMELLGRYKSCIHQKGKAILVAVCKANFSEGLDLKDEYSRMVIIVGVPYSNKIEPKTVLRKQLMESIPNESSFNDWYTVEAMRVVNQCSGRLIRSKQDYGALILFDSRYTQNKNYFSVWIKQRLKEESKFENLISSLERFFKKPMLGKRKQIDLNTPPDSDDD